MFNQRSAQVGFIRPACSRVAVRRSLRALPVFVAPLVALALAAPPAFAQVEEIVVTARKKEENLAEVPVAIEAVTAEDIARKGITDMARLADQSASIKFDMGSSRQDTRLSIRGLSPTRGRQNAAILVDGIDISSEAVSTSGGSILVNQRLLAVERIDIVKGPQSALWGRSAFNGAINFVTKDPSDVLAGSTSMDLNAEDQYMVSGDIGGPVFGDRLGVIVNGAWWDKDGFYDNTLTGENVGFDEGYGFAVKTKSQFDNGLTIRGRASFEHYEQGQAPEVFLGFNKVLQQPETAFQPNPDPRIPLGPPGLQAPYNAQNPDFNSALFCLQDNLAERAGASALIPNLLNQTLIDRYTQISMDPNNPAIGDGPHCQRKVVIFAGEVPDSDDLRLRLSTNPFTPGQDYEGIDGDTMRFSVVADWELERGTITSLTGYTHDENDESVDFSRFAVNNPSSPFRDDWANLFQSNTSKMTRQFQQELRYATNFDGPVNATVGATYWEEDVTNHSKSLTMQANGSYCFYNSVTGTPFPGFGDAPGCPGYTELPIQQFVGPGGIQFADPNETAVFTGVEKYTRDSPIDRNTDHLSIYGLIEIDATENTSVTLEGRYSNEDLEVLGPVFYSAAATGGPGSWAICGVPGRPCYTDDLPGLSFLQRPPAGTNVGPFWNLQSFQNTYDVWKGIVNDANAGTITLRGKNTPLFTTPEEGGVLNPQCADDPQFLARERAIDAEIAAAAAEGRDPVDPQFDLFNPFCQGKLKRNDRWFSPKITISHDVTEDALVYAYWAHSEKPGGFGLFTIGASGLREDLAAYEPEKMDTWEIGTKTTVLDGTLYLEASAFFNDYVDKQVLVQGLGPDGRSVSKIDNAPAEVLGAELSAQWRPETMFLGGEWMVGGAYLYIDGEYKDYIDIATSENNIALAGNCEPATLRETVIVNNPSTGQPTAQEIFKAACRVSYDGNELERAPKHSFVGNVSYSRLFGDTLEGIAELGMQWKDKQYIEYTNESWLGDYWNFDLRFGVRSDRWEVLGYVENLLDDDAVRSTSSQPGLGCCFVLGVATDIPTAQLGSLGSTAEVPNARAAFLTPPRVFGLRANWKFGGE